MVDLSRFGTIGQGHSALYSSLVCLRRGTGLALQRTNKVWYRDHRHKLWQAPETCAVCATIVTCCFSCTLQSPLTNQMDTYDRRGTSTRIATVITRHVAMTFLGYQ